LPADWKVNEPKRRDKQAVARPPLICQFSPEGCESALRVVIRPSQSVYHQEEDLTDTQLCFYVSPQQGLQKTQASQQPEV